MTYSGILIERPGFTFDKRLVNDQRLNRGNPARVFSDMLGYQSLNLGGNKGKRRFQILTFRCFSRA